MALTIDSENAKRIRTPFEVHCGITARIKENLTFVASGNIAIRDQDINTYLDNDKIHLRRLTDLSEEGFPVDGSCELYDSSLEASETNGKIGVQTAVGETVDMTVIAKTEIAAVTIVVKGDGVIIANGNTYEIHQVVIIPVNAKTILLQFKPDEDNRMIIESITPGITVEFSNENLVSCLPTLRSNTDMIEPAFETSEIEIQAYWPDDIAEAVSNLDDNMGIWYYAGYPGNYSKQRKFYLSEPASMKDNVLTIRGVDASDRLGNTTMLSQVINTTIYNGDNVIYNKLARYVAKAGITVAKANTEKAPVAKKGGTARTIIIDPINCRDVVTDIMNLAHYDNFYPTFVDAGIPRLYHSKPKPKWTIYEEDCSNVVREVARNIAKIKAPTKSTDDTAYAGLMCDVKRSTKWANLAVKNVVAGKSYSFSKSETYFWAMTASNAKSGSVLVSDGKIIWKAKKTTYTKPKKTIYYVKKKVKGKWKWKKVKSSAYSHAKKKYRKKIKPKKYNQSVVRGKATSFNNVKGSVVDTNKRRGTTIEVSPIAHGKIYQGSKFRYPNYMNLFERSNVTGSFTWKGDPRMQPRDVVRLYHTDTNKHLNDMGLDYEIVTISKIELRHENGGTQANITYRKGIC